MLKALLTRWASQRRNLVQLLQLPQRCGTNTYTSTLTLGSISACRRWYVGCPIKTYQISVVSSDTHDGCYRVNSRLTRDLCTTKYKSTPGGGRDLHNKQFSVNANLSVCLSVCPQGLYCRTLFNGRYISSLQMIFLRHI